VRTKVGVTAVVVPELQYLAREARCGVFTSVVRSVRVRLKWNMITFGIGISILLF
jgi:hypothetical protein